MKQFQSVKMGKSSSRTLTIHSLQPQLFIGSLFCVLFWLFTSQVCLMGLHCMGSAAHYSWKLLKHQLIWKSQDSYIFTCNIIRAVVTQPVMLDRSQMHSFLTCCCSDWRSLLRIGNSSLLVHISEPVSSSPLQIMFPKHLSNGVQTFRKIHSIN